MTLKYTDDVKLGRDHTGCDGERARSNIQQAKMVFKNLDQQIQHTLVDHVKSYTYLLKRYYYFFLLECFKYLTYSNSKNNSTLKLALMM